MPSLSELPGSLKRSKFIKALIRLGFELDKVGGDGSHYKVVWPPTQKIIVIQYDFRKDVLYETLKDIEEISGITWYQIKDKL